MSFVSIAVPVAIGGSALVGAGASLYASNQQANAAGNALAFQQQQYATQQKNFAPYLQAGNNATYSLSKLLGIGPNGQSQTPDYSGFSNSPDYQFASQQGNLGAIRTANSQGLNLSGGMLKDLSTFNNGLASQQYNSYYNKLMGLSAQGQASAANSATAGNTAAGQIGNTMMGQGQAQASGAVGAANALGGGVSNSLLAHYLGQSPSAYADSYGGGSPLTGDAYGGSTKSPLPGLVGSDYGVGY